jgi:hypothetical protein
VAHLYRFDAPWLFSIWSKTAGELIGIVESHISHSIPEEKLYAYQVKVVNKSGRVFDKSRLYNLAIAR